jgi:hypothetical protein
MLSLIIALLIALLAAAIVSFIVHFIRPDWQNFAFGMTFLLALLAQLGALR